MINITTMATPNFVPKVKTKEKVRLDPHIKLISEALFAISGFLIFISLSPFLTKIRGAAIEKPQGEGNPNFAILELATEESPTFVSHSALGSSHYLAVIEAGNFIEVFKYTSGGKVEKTYSQNAEGHILTKSAIGDFNNDGYWDLAATETQAGKISFWFGDGQGQLTFSNSFETPDFSPDRVATGDFNQDDNLDIIMIDWLHGDIMVMLNDGEGNFRYKSRYETGGGPQELIVQDFNGDGFQDFIVATMTYNNSLQMFGNGTGEFFFPQEYELGYDGYTSSYTDLDEDGIKDYIAGSGHQILFFKGKPNGTFRKPGVPYGYGFGPIQYRSVVGDFNGDGHQDVFSFIRGKNDDDPPKIQWWWGNGTGILTASQKLEIDSLGAAGEVWPYAADFNADNKTDIIIPANNSGSPHVKVYLMR